MVRIAFAALLVPRSFKPPKLARHSSKSVLAACKTLAISVRVQPDGWARGEREGYGEPCDVTSLSLSLSSSRPSEERIAIEYQLRHTESRMDGSEEVPSSGHEEEDRDGRPDRGKDGRARADRREDVERPPI